MIKKLTYSITINAPKEKVFQTMTDKSLYAFWAKAWGEEMSYDGDWTEGSYVTFFDTSGEGTKALVEEVRPNEYTRLKHTAMVTNRNVEVEQLDETMQKWIGSLEEYAFTNLDENSTRVEITMTMDEMFQDMADEPWPQALLYLKELCEQN